MSVSALAQGAKVGLSRPRGASATAGNESEPGGGQLRAVDRDGKTIAPFPLQHTDVHAFVSGGVAQVTIEQTFQNPYDRGIEAVYVFPLPHEAAVDDLEIQIGSRVVRGEIRTRQAAREIYEDAKRQGRVAALLDQERPNVFTQQVANIQPGHEIVVRIRYVENLQYEDGAYEMVFPTVVGPRYTPGKPLGGSDVEPASYEDVEPRRGKAGERRGSRDASTPQSGSGWARDTDRVPDASRITPPVVPPGKRTGHDIMIDVDLEAGVPLQDVTCTSHVVDVERDGREAARVRLRPSDTLPNKDFVLRWRVAGQDPEFGLLTHRDPRQHEGLGFFSLVLQPEAEVTASEARPKEMVFVLDTSGSMSGEPIAKSKAAMRWALQHLNPDDTFQVIRFSESASPFAPRPIANTPANVQRALAYVDQLEGEGGTEMLAGIEAALGFPADAQRLRIVCFLTDGYVGNEAEIFSAVRREIGGARLFSFGIGNSVNHYLLDGLAEEGRGVVDYVALDGDTREIVERFYERVARPYLTDISIDWGDLDVQDVDPARVPDLFAGQPLLVTGRYRKSGADDVVIRGRLGRQAFERRVRLDLPARNAENPALPTLWARRRLDGHMRRMVNGEQEALVRQVTDLALEYRLMSRYTSFVAVDNQVVSKDGKPMLVAQPVEMPEGVSYEGVFGKEKVEMMQGAQLGGRARGLAIAAPMMARSEAPRMMPGTPAIGLPPAAAVEKRSDPRAARQATPSTSSQEAVFGDEEDGDKRNAAAALDVRLESDRSEVRAGDPIRIRIVVRNTTGETILLPKRIDLRDGTLQLRVSRGQSMLPAPRLWNTKSTDFAALKPGEKRTFVVTLSAAGGYAFALPGTYEIEIVGIGNHAMTQGAHLTIRVRS